MMNKEIKEILDRIETVSEIFDCLLKPEECIELLDYITNLQQIEQELTNNWNELEEWLAREYIKTGYEEYYRLALKDLYDKMKEINGVKHE